MATGLLASGVGKGSRVGILMPNSVDWVVVAIAVARIGAVFVPINTFYQANELAWTVRHADLTHLAVRPSFLAHDYLERLETALPGLAEQSIEHSLQLVVAPFLRAIFVWSDCRSKLGAWR